eukprot:TRINITY_DN7305_c0_g1_i1.p1 TRINITY_DN7305_c0_g1~~TRINITY_DN7305_c0_g1_i1.p1  ORF type:complete len:410 (+),score=90.17 TRINITY_DN7305_c0_g1_i1:64-1293(+)
MSLGILRKLNINGEEKKVIFQLRRKLKDGRLIYAQLGESLNQRFHFETEDFEGDGKMKKLADLASAYLEENGLDLKVPKIRLQPSLEQYVELTGRDITSYHEELSKYSISLKYTVVYSVNKEQLQQVFGEDGEEVFQQVWAKITGPKDRPTALAGFDKLQKVFLEILRPNAGQWQIKDILTNNEKLYEILDSNDLFENALSTMEISKIHIKNGYFTEALNQGDCEYLLTLLDGYIFDGNREFFNALKQLVEEKRYIANAVISKKHFKEELRFTPHNNCMLKIILGHGNNIRKRGINKKIKSRMVSLAKVVLKYVDDPLIHCGSYHFNALHVVFYRNFTEMTEVVSDIREKWGRQFEYMMLEPNIYGETARYLLCKSLEENYKIKRSLVSYDNFRLLSLWNDMINRSARR